MKDISKQIKAHNYSQKILPFSKVALGLSL